MRKLLLGILLSTSLSFGGFFQERDKKAHMTVTSTIGFVGTLIARKHGATPTEAFFWGLGSALVVGLGKEMYDSRDGGTGFDNRDMLANALGGSLGASVGYVVVRF